MNNNFNELGVAQEILKALEEMGYNEPTEVQAKAIPHILNKEDLIVMSKTGSGKTAVLGVSMPQLPTVQKTGPQALILTPTRELAVQIDNEINKIAKYMDFNTTAVFGQHSANVEMKALSAGVSIITGTPGRVYDHIVHGNIKTSNIRFLVLDEADRMLDMGFLEQVQKIIRKLPVDRITLLFSATMPSEIFRISRDYMKNPITIEIESPTKTVDTIEQCYYRVDNNEKNTQLLRLLLTQKPDSCIIFCNTRRTVDRVQTFLFRKGYASRELHGDIAQSTRLNTIQQFKQGKFHILVATDVAARGIHIDSLSLVINYDVPFEKDSYVHRIGRTGRAGNVGRAITLATADDIMSLYEIEEHIGALIEERELPSEEEFNELKKDAKKWIQDNSIKARTKQSPETTQNRVGNRTGPKQPYEHKTVRPPQNRDGKQVRETNQDREIKQNREVRQVREVRQNKDIKPNRDIRQDQEFKQNREIKQNRDIRQDREIRQNSRAINKGVQASIPKVPNTNKESKTNTRADTVKKPLIRRLLDRILGTK